MYVSAHVVTHACLYMACASFLWLLAKVTLRLSQFTEWEVEAPRCGIRAGMSAGPEGRGNMRVGGVRPAGCLGMAKTRRARETPATGKAVGNRGSCCH